jgi:cell division protein FtsL
MWWTLMAILLLVQIAPAFAEDLALQKEIGDLEAQIHEAEAQLTAAGVDPDESPNISPDISTEQQ